LFGGHRGGGKKRLDGLPAGSPEALAADRKKNAERMREDRARKRGAALPAALPSAGAVAAGAPLVDAAPAVDGSPGPVSVVVVGTVVPWKSSLLQKPALLLTRILDRWRTGRIFQKLDRAQLPETVAAEIKKDVAWKDSAREDFSAALADAAAIELNKRAVSAGQSHWINLSLSAGELALAHYDLCARIDKLVLAANGNRQEAKDAKAETKTPGA
jgi:hypothetical protein